MSNDIRYILRLRLPIKKPQINATTSHVSLGVFLYKMYKLLITCNYSEQFGLDGADVKTFPLFSAPRQDLKDQKPSRRSWIQTFEVGDFRPSATDGDVSVLYSS